MNDRLHRAWQWVWGGPLAPLHRLRVAFFGDPAGFIDRLPEPWRSIGLVELAAGTWLTSPLHARLVPHWRLVEATGGAGLAVAFDADGAFMAAAEAWPGRPMLLRLGRPAARVETHAYGGEAAQLKLRRWNGWSAFRRARRMGLRLAPALKAAWPTPGPRYIPGGAGKFVGPGPHAYRWWLSEAEGAGEAPAPAGEMMFLVETRPDDPAAAASLASLEAQTWPHWRLAAPHEATPPGAARLSLAPGDTLAPDALALLAAAFADPEVCAVYADEDALDAEGLPAYPVFKPGFDAERLKTQDYIGDAVARRDQGTAVRHVPRPLWRRRVKPDWPVREGAPRRLPEPAPKVAVVVPTRDEPNLLRGCAEGVLSRTRYPNLELVVVDNGSTDPKTLRRLAALAETPRVRVMRIEGPFDFAALNNAAVAAADADLICLLNDDTLVIDPDWLTEMAALAVRPDVGAVGAKLYFPDGRIQHAGVVLGLGPLKVAGHAFRGGPGELGGPQDMLKVVREVSAVTAACLVVERAKFEAVGGFDGSFQVAFNDVDLCLRLNDRGWKTLWTPHARMVHLESASRGKEAAERKAARMAVETARMHERWGERLLCDPYFHPALVAERYALGRVRPAPVAR